jgi:DNA-binding response OmpR family regulator
MLRAVARPARLVHDGVFTHFQESILKRVLIVEDQEDIRELIRVTLEFEDFDIHEAADGPTGLAAAQRLVPDLILLDVMMPGGMDGLQVCKAVRADGRLRRCKVVLLTGRTQAADRQAGSNAGADEYLVKPFSPLELLTVVKRLL